jgi:DNA-binding NarL/FixJ family response regulator
MARVRGEERRGQVQPPDDHPLLLDGLEQLFARQGDFSVLARAGDGVEALDAVRRLRPEVLILDLKMPRLDGLAVLRAVQSERLPTRVVVLTAALEDSAVMEMVGLGVGGVVLKELAPRVLVEAVREVHAGGRWLEGRAVGRALEQMVRREAGQRQAAAQLTPREIEIVRQVASGLRNKEIAKRLGISESTVKIHLHNIYEKLGVDGRVELTLYAQARGLV